MWKRPSEGSSGKRQRTGEGRGQEGPGGKGPAPTVSKKRVSTMIELHIMSGPEIGRSFEFPNDAVTIGRSPENDIQISDRFVSRRHMKILKRGTKYFVEDLQSRNGTFVNGIPVNADKEMELTEGLPIVIGMSVICLGEASSEQVRAFLDSIVPQRAVCREVPTSEEEKPLTPEKRLELIKKASESFGQAGGTEEIIGRVLDSVFEIFRGAEKGTVFLSEKESGKVLKKVARLREGIEADESGYDENLVEQVLKSGKALVVSEGGDQESTPLSDTARISPVRYVMCVPLKSKSHIIGVIYVESFRRPWGFSKDDLSSLIAMAVPAATAIENALVHTRRTASS